MIMNIQFLYENEKGSVVDEYGRPEPMDYIVDEEQFRLETLSSHTQYLAQLPLENEKAIEAMQMEKEEKPGNGIDKARFFKLLFEKCLSAAAAAKQLGSHARIRKTGRPLTLNEECKKVILECIDANSSVVLDDMIKQLLQAFTELKVSKNWSSEEKIQERLDWIHKWEKTDIDSDESTFHINLKRSMARSKKGSSAVATGPKVRTKTTTILGPRPDQMQSKASSASIQ
ncbi:hypothetical protein G6F46_002733 [Rhizopus delemar]|uniref:Uncharacterized protein n=1 Tax=Rhizopus oryzae TaxID=64495 RepID=A0A9P7CF22_RHIOR|nr:hypothetical protein G6F51_002793 [Rhizopus arrhizus]KAG1559520.1 hypothetical protein G6F49_003521 [Rhizopus delemar]KAG1595455.1 hypothetical protein G6F48_000673 [Rhizopus delemar]KAG1602502.1 hypothetical protein G6F47_002712 [Rhizopus delemar]KAG1619989.1 hypothetical protein G6F46_002733 [Rhizopus delemar]